MKISKKQITRLQRCNDIRERLDALEITNGESIVKADLWRFLMSTGGLNDKGIDMAHEWTCIMEKYNNRKVA